MTIERAIRILMERYVEADQSDFVKDPVAYALYKTWKLADGDTEVDITEAEVEDELIPRRQTLSSLLKQPKLTRSVVRRVLLQIPPADRKVN